MHLLLEEFGTKKKTNTVDPAARAGVKNVILFYLFYFISGGVNFVMYPNDNHPEKYLAKIWIQEKHESKISF